MTLKKMPIADFGEILTTAVRIGYHWNQAHAFLVKDVYPDPEESSREHYLSETQSNAYGWSDDTLKVMLAFFEEHGVNAFVLEK